MLPHSLKKLVFELSKLPAVGERSAYRIAYHLLQRSLEDVSQLTSAITEAKRTLRWCSFCRGLSDEDVCDICKDRRRVRNQICVVERPSDVYSLERSGAYRGLYHVLHGVWSPLRGVRPEHLTVDRLVARVSGDASPGDPVENPLAEIILATSTTVEGDATALYIANELDQRGLVISRLAQGLPKGGELEYADEITLGASFEGRRKI
ncbi:MAG TPA: recombination mediator RecR [Oligoflexia bacterium]|nr:recombination mediator RecR [Oligoflexia bacterium]HMP49281.1 recombination mediator RecR [Oligoflexia bacterium]